jgi:ABC-type uncharacterized transport system substrate-binding protein
MIFGFGQAMLRKSKKLQVVFYVIIHWLIFLSAPTYAQQLKNFSRIGFLLGLSPSANSDRMEAFRQGLRDLGYVEGKNIIIEIRSAEGKIERLPDLAAELVHRKVDVIVTAGPTPTRAAKRATKTIPIVMTFDIDPVGSGLVASLARPGGNITGMSNLAPEISGKHLEFLKEIIPRLTRVAVLETSTIPGNEQELKEAERAARALGIQLQHVEVRTSGDIDTAFRAATIGRAEAALVGTSRVLFSRRARVAELAAKYRLPAMYIEQEFVRAGGLMTYGTSIVDLYRRAATYVDKILKGAKPADLPVEQPTKFEFIVNLKAAKQIGLTIPPNVLARADRVIR